MNGQKIVESLHELNAQGYWKSLEKAQKQSPIQRETHSSSERKVGGDHPMIVTKVTPDGWVLEQSPYASQKRGGPYYDSDTEEEEEDPDAAQEEEEFLLRLPKNIASLGKEGMTISNMNLKFRDGFWSPFNPFYDRASYGCSDDLQKVCANVYPPEKGWRQSHMKTKQLVKTFREFL